MQTLKDWYLARLRLLGTRQLCRTPMGLVAEDRDLIQQYVLASSVQRSVQNERVLEAIQAKGSSQRDLLIFVFMIVLGAGGLLILALL